MPHLVLTRRPLETVTITVPPSDKPRTVVVEYIESRRGDGSQIAMGFHADRDIEVFRTEVLERRQLFEIDAAGLRRVTGTDSRD
jgi:sRNA-binding carbon storage regulator CsrA